MICVSSPDESVCEMSSMNQCEDREEGGPPSKTTGPGPGPGPGPEPSCVSFRSDRSADFLIDFKQSHEKR